MRAIRLISLCFGLGAVAFTVEFMYRSWSTPWDSNYIWILVTLWPGSFIHTISHPQVLGALKPLHYIFLIVLIGTPVLAVIMAKNLNLFRLGWFVVTLLFPYALTILALIAERPSSSKNKHKLLNRFTRRVGLLMRFVFAIMALGGIIGIVLIWIGFAQYLTDPVFGPKDRSGWLIMGTADQFLSWKNLFLSLGFAIVGILGVGVAEELEKKPL